MLYNNNSNNNNNNNNNNNKSVREVSERRAALSYQGCEKVCGGVGTSPQTRVPGNQCASPTTVKK